MARTPELLCADVRDELATIARLERLFASRFRRAAMLLHVQVNGFLGQIEGLTP
jgi:hypothetical protein